MFAQQRAATMGTRLQLELELMPEGDPNYLARREVIRAFAAVRRRYEPAPEASLAFQLVPAGELLLALAQACKLTDLEIIEALGAELATDLLWPKDWQHD